MTVYRGKVASFDNSAWTASVRMDGSAAQTFDNVAVASDIAETDMDVGNKVLVDTGDHNHPSDFVVTVAWPGPPAAAGGADGFPPTGSIVAWPTATAPSLWILCDGSAVSRTTYAALFALIGTAYGAGDGTTTFNLPNLKGRAIVGYDSSQTEFDTLGETGGSKTHTLITGEMPAHGHTQDSHNHTQDSHNHTQDTHNHTQNQHLHVQDTHNHTQNAHLHVQDPHSHGMAEGQTDGAGVLMDRSNAASATTATTDAATAVNQNTTPTNNTTVAVNQNTTPTNNTTVATNQGTVATNQGTVATNQSTGGGGAHNNLQPYIALNYVIKT